MELLSPAGNVEKLYYAYAYGADAAYIGLKKFSLRVKADNFYDDEYKKVIELKKQFPGKKLHCALNISFHNSDIDNFISNIDYFKAYPIDAFIVQDIGIVPILQKHFPEAALHVSTQASCINREAVKMYKSLGFSRVVLGREVSLKEIREIKDAVPDMELEAFCHGAMCIAYAGRCLMSAYLTGRSAQAGACSHTCRWDYDVLADPKKAKELAESGALVLREKKRPDSYFPVSSLPYLYPPCEAGMHCHKSDASCSYSYMQILCQKNVKSCIICNFMPGFHKFGRPFTFLTNMHPVWLPWRQKHHARRRRLFHRQRFRRPTSRCPSSTHTAHPADTAAP